jgi:hypothetical protein
MSFPLSSLSTVSNETCAPSFSLTPTSFGVPIWACARDAALESSIDERRSAKNNHLLDNIINDFLIALPQSWS